MRWLDHQCVAARYGSTAWRDSAAVLAVLMLQVCCLRRTTLPCVKEDHLSINNICLATLLDCQSDPSFNCPGYKHSWLHGLRGT